MNGQIVPRNEWKNCAEKCMDKLHEICGFQTLVKIWWEGVYKMACYYNDLGMVSKVYMVSTIIANRQSKKIPPRTIENQYINSDISWCMMVCIHCYLTGLICSKYIYYLFSSPQMILDGGICNRISLNQLVLLPQYYISQLLCDNQLSKWERDNIPVTYSTMADGQACSLINVCNTIDWYYYTVRL